MLLPQGQQKTGQCRRSRIGGTPGPLRLCGFYVHQHGKGFLPILLRDFYKRMPISGPRRILSVLYQGRRLVR